MGRERRAAMNDIKSPSSNEMNELKAPSDTENNSFDPDKRIDVDQKENTEDKKDNSGYDMDKRVDVAEKEGTYETNTADSTPNVERGNTPAINEGQNENTTNNEVKEKNEPIKNKQDGLERERKVEEELKSQYPESEGYDVLSEVYLRDKNGSIVKDPVTGEARRIDFVVVKGEKVVDSIEVTSKTADKTEQSAKEARIRDNGGNYLRDTNGKLVEILPDVQTRIERRD